MAKKTEINKRDIVGATRLFEAVAAGDVAKVKRLLKAGADPNIPENNGTTPLMEAAGAASTELITLLVRNGASVDSVDNFGDSAADYARSRAGTDAAELLRRLTSGRKTPRNDERSSRKKRNTRKRE